MSRDIDLSSFTEQELVELNRRIVERIKMLRQARTFNDMARFELGDTVSFTPECGHVVVGTVVRLNKKTITVAAKDGNQWRVAPSFLSRVTDAETAQESKQGALVSIEAAARGRKR
jgi:hypothetical protein